MGIVTDLIYIVLVALVGGCFAQLLRQPLIIGYIFAGIIVGPHTGGFTVQNIHDIEMLAEVGVALLLFTLGLEFSFGELTRLARITFIGAPIQIILCIVAAYFIATVLGFPPSDALWIGATISLSSTMVVLKTLAAKDALQTQAGRIMLGILIAQDLAVIPLMLVLPQLAGSVTDYSAIVSALVKSALFLVGMYFAGTRVFPWAFAQVSRVGSRELFFLATLAVALGGGFLSYQLGLSFALGAFVAGMLLSETDFNHQALSDVSSLRDLFGLIFFVSVGMLFDPSFFVSNFTQVGLFTITVILTKAVILGSLVRFFRYDERAFWMVGLGLSQVGEFAFVIANAGNRSGQLSSQSFSLMIAVAVVSMVMTPALFWLGNRMAQGRESDFRAPAENTERELDGHVVILGGGVVGQYVAEVLSALHRPYVVVESDYKTVTRMRDAGMEVIYGDGSHHAILEIAGVRKARLVVVTTTADKILPSILRELRHLNEDVPVVVRVAEVDDIEHLSSHDIHELVQPQLEVGLEMVRQSLLALGSGEAEIFPVLAQLRSKRYASGKGNETPLSSAERQFRATQLLDFMWIEIEEEMGLSGRSLRELALRERFGVSVAAVIRGDEFTPNPGPDFTLSSRDMIGVLGTRTQLSSFRTDVEGS